MRRISGFVLAASLLLPLLLAQAAEVTHIYTNNYFANAFSFDPDTGTTVGIFVTRMKGKGTPVDSIFMLSVGPDGFASVTGTLPKGAFRVGAQSTSLDVDIADIVGDN